MKDIKEMVEMSDSPGWKEYCSEGDLNGQSVW